MRATAYDLASLRQHGATGSSKPSLLLRLRVRLTRSQLDRQIATGEPRVTNAALALRAQQLVSARTRLALARDLRRVVDHVERPRSPSLLSAVVIEPRTVSRGRHALLGLAERLEAAGPVDPAGVVLVRRLLTDGCSPLFNINSEQTVIQAVWNIEDALQARDIA